MRKITKIIAISLAVGMYMLYAISVTNVTEAAYRTYGNFIHLIGTTNRPSSNAGPGAGTGPTITNNGTDMSGTVQIVAGSAPAINDVIVDLSFNTVYATAPYCTIAPANATAGTLGAVYVTTGTTKITINSITSPLIAGSTYNYNYVCAQ